MTRRATRMVDEMVDTAHAVFVAIVMVTLVAAALIGAYLAGWRS